MRDPQEIIQNFTESDSFERLLIIVVATVVVMVIAYFLRKGISRHISDVSHQYRTRKALNILTYILVVSIVLFVYSDKLGDIGIALGLAGAGVAFALQEVITAIAGWFSIMLSNSIRLGQRVKIGNIKGDIIDISVIRTTIMEVGDWVDGDLYNGRITAISNSFMFTDALQNYSADYPFLWDEVKVPIDNGSDFQAARKIFYDVAMEVCGDFARDSQKIWTQMHGKYKIENAEVMPTVALKFDEKWITFTIRYVVDYKKRRSTQDKIYTRLLEEIRKHADTIVIASASLAVTNLELKDDHSQPGDEKQ